MREQVQEGNYQLKLHAVERASQRGIDPLDIAEALLSGTVIEEYPNDARGQSCLVYGKTQGGRDLHVVCGLAATLLWVITVYEPDPAEWIDPKTRRIAP
jgi:hypothetical protein